MESFAVKTPGAVYLLAGNIYTGTHGGMWYRIWVAEKVLHACVWPLPWCFDKADEAEKSFAEFAPDADGIAEAEHWVETQYTENIARWRAAPLLPPVQRPAEPQAAGGDNGDKSDNTGTEAAHTGL